MARKRIRMKKIKQILQLQLEAGYSERTIARALKISRPTVHAYTEAFAGTGKAWDDVREMSDEEIERLLIPRREIRTTRLEKLEEHLENVWNELSKKGATRQGFWREYAENNPTAYGYSQYCEHLKKWTKRNPEVRDILDHPPGLEMFIDYSGLKAHYTRLSDGQRVETEILVAILGHSQYTFACATETQKQTDTIQASNEAFDYFGGVTAVTVPDNMKTAVTKTDRYEPILNRVFEDMAEYYGTVVVPARQGKPRDKALVENAVQNIQRSVLFPLRKRTFHSIKELNVAIRERLDAYNARNFQKRKVSRKELWERDEKPVLKPLPARAYEYRNVLNVTVPPNYHVEIREDEHRYSVPHRYAGKAVKVVYTATIVEIYHDNVRIAFHFRDRTSGGRTTLPEHRPEQHKILTPEAVQGIEAHAAYQGVHVGSLVSQIFRTAEYVLKARRSACGIIGLGKKFGTQRLDLACRMALSEGTLAYRRVKEILEKGIDIRFRKDDDMQKKLPLHGNTRGAHAFA